MCSGNQSPASVNLIANHTKCNTLSSASLLRSIVPKPVHSAFTGPRDIYERRARQSFYLQARLGDCPSYPSTALHSRAKARAPPSRTQPAASRSFACLSLISCPLFPLPFFSSTALSPSDFFSSAMNLSISSVLLISSKRGVVQAA